MHTDVAENRIAQFRRMLARYGVTYQVAGQPLQVVPSQQLGGHELEGGGFVGGAQGGFRVSALREDFDDRSPQEQIFTDESGESFRVVPPIGTEPGDPVIDLTLISEHASQ